MKIATKEERRKRDNLLANVYEYRKTNKEQKLKETEEKLHKLFSDFVFTRPLKEPEQSKGEYANQKTKTLRLAACERLLGYEKQLSSGELTTLKKLQVDNKVAYVSQYISRLESEFKWFGNIRKLGQPKPEYVNRGRMGYSFEEVRDEHIDLIRYAANYVNNRTNGALEVHDIEQEGEVLILNIFNKKGKELGWDSFHAYFKYSLWRHMSELKNKVFREKEHKKTQRENNSEIPKITRISDSQCNNVDLKKYKFSNEIETFITAISNGTTIQDYMLEHNLTQEEIDRMSADAQSFLEKA